MLSLFLRERFELWLKILHLSSFKARLSVVEKPRSKLKQQVYFEFRLDSIKLVNYLWLLHRSGFHHLSLMSHEDDRVMGRKN